MGSHFELPKVKPSPTTTMYVTIKLLHIYLQQNLKGFMYFGKAVILAITDKGSALFNDLHVDFTQHNTLLFVK